MKRVPVALHSGIRKLFCGPESFTPDLQPIVGEAPEIRNYFVAAGLNSIGILSGGGIGRALAHWIVHGRADIDVTGFNIDRLHKYQSNPQYRRSRSVEALGMVYECHYPGRQMTSARGARRSPLHDRLVGQGAYFKDVSGWEVPDWYAPPGVAPVAPAPSWRWQEQEWFSYWKAEHAAARNGVVLMDMSFMAKFMVCGSAAGGLLNWISANQVDGDAGRVTYTQWLNDAGKIEADLTVAKLDHERYLVVASDTAHRHAATWMQRHIATGAQVFVSDVTSGMAQLNIQGPRSRELMQSLTPARPSYAGTPGRTRTRRAPGTPRSGCSRAAMNQAASSATPPSANTPASGPNCNTTQARPGVRMPDTSRKLEYTADISVRCDGLTDIRKGRPAQTSSSTRKYEASTRMSTVASGNGDTSAARRNSPPLARKPVRTASRTVRRCIQRNINGARNRPTFANELAMPPTSSPSPFLTAKMPT